MSYPTYSEDNDTANGAAHEGKLHDELAALGITSAEFLGVSHEGDVITVLCDQEPSAADKTAIDNAVAAHDGVPPLSLEFIASSKLVAVEQAITETTNWQVLGGVVTNPGFFEPVLQKVVGRLVGGFKTDGDGAEVRLVEEKVGESDVVMHSSSWLLGDTEDAWGPNQFNTSVAPRSGENTFRLEGRLNGATSASLRFVSLTLLRVG